MLTRMFAQTASLLTKYHWRCYSTLVSKMAKLCKADLIATPHGKTGMTKALAAEQYRCPPLNEKKQTSSLGPNPIVIVLSMHQMTLLEVQNFTTPKR